MEEISIVSQNDKHSEDMRMFAEFRVSQSSEIRNAIVSKYLYLADIVTRKFLNRGVEYDDLYQVASIALITAVNRFETDKGVKFSSFATPTMVGEIKKYFRDKVALIRVPRRIYEVYKNVNNAREALTQELGRTPTLSDIADYLNIDVETVIETIESWNIFSMQSYESAVVIDDHLELTELVGDDDPEFENIENRDFLDERLKSLDGIEKTFTRMRYDENMTQKEIAEEMNVSQMYVSRLEKRVLKKLRSGEDD